MSGGWRATAASSDSEDDVVFMGPVTERELEISRLLNETICLPDSRDVSGSMADLEEGMRGIQVAGPCSSTTTMPEIALHTAAGDTSFRDSASSASENPPEDPPAATDTTSDSRQWQELLSECPLTAPDTTSDSRQWQEMPSECPLTAPDTTSDSRQWQEMPSECPLTAPDTTSDSRQWQKMPSECPLTAPDTTSDSCQWKEMPSECPLTAPHNTSDSRQWQELPSECAPPEAAVQSRTWEELPTQDTTSWRTLLSDVSAAEDGAETSAQGQRSLLSALRSELGDGVSPPDRQDEDGRAGGSGSSGLLLAMHRQMASPESVASFHTCSGGGSRRTTGLSERFFSPSARLDSTGGTDGRPADLAMVESEEDNTAAEAGSAYGVTVVPLKDDIATEVDTDEYAVETGDEEKCDVSPDILPVRPRTIGSSVSDDEPVFVEQGGYTGPQPPVTPGRGSSVYSASGDAAAVGSASARTSTISLTESESRFSSGGDSQSEFDNTLEMMERLLELEAEERRMETILRERTAGEGSAALERLVDQALMTGDGAALEGEPSPSAADRTEEEPVVPVPTAGHDAPTPAPETNARREPVPGEPKTRGMTAKSPVRSNGAPRGRGATPRRGSTTPRGGGATPSSATKSARGGNNLLCASARAASRGHTPAKTPVRPSPVGRLATPLRSALGHKTQMLAPPAATPRTTPLNLADVTSPVARYIRDAPPPLVQNLRPRDRQLNTAVPQPRPPPKLQAVAEEVQVLQDTNAGAGDGARSRIPVKVSLSGSENQGPALPEVSYKSSGNLVMDRSSWDRLVKKNTAMNKKLGRFLASPKPVLAVKHTGHKSVASRRIKWHDEFSVPDTTVRVRPMRRSISDQDITVGADGSLMEVSVCEVKSARPVLKRPAVARRM